MKGAVTLLVLVSACAAVGKAQPVYVYSEFAQIDAQGNVTAPSRPREILSPAIVRNGFASFQIVIQTENGKPWVLHLGQNPEHAVMPTLYRQAGDRLQKVELPVKGEGTQVFWLDLWTDRAAQPGRIKVEPQLNIDEDWVIYPMEIRVEDPVAPDVKWKPEVNAPAVRDVMRGFLCGAQVTPPAQNSEGYTRDGLRYRNALQDVGLAPQVPKAELLKRFGACDAAAPTNPESYFAVRDYLFRHELH